MQSSTFYLQDVSELLGLLSLNWQDKPRIRAAAALPSIPGRLRALCAAVASIFTDIKFISSGTSLLKFPEIRLTIFSYGCVAFGLIVTGLIFTVFSIFYKDSQIGKGN